jgi:hypothetical protein
MYFGDKNIVTEEITYDYANNCRDDENKCGINGVYFNEEKNLKLKLFKHKIRSDIKIQFGILLIFVIFFKIFYATIN